MSRKSYPKQFSNPVGKSTLFQNSANRLTSSSVISFASPITLTNAIIVFVESNYEIGIDPGPILIEPEAKNTAPAVLAASIFALAKDPDAVLLIAPSDHVIPDTKTLRGNFSWFNYAENGKLVTFGIKPTHPEIGQGYLELSSNNLDHFGTSDVVKFLKSQILQR